MVSLFLKGIPIPEIAVQFKTTAYYIKKDLMKHGLYVPARFPKNHHRSSYTPRTHDPNRVKNVKAPYGCKLDRVVPQEVQM